MTLQRLSKITLAGWKSIREVRELELRPLNLLIGANGAGKSNFASFFRLLNWMAPTPGNLQTYIADEGGANSLLHKGVGATQQITLHLTFEGETARNEYRTRLFYVTGNSLMFAEEQFRYTNTALTSVPQWFDLGAGHSETGLLEAARATPETAKSKTAKFILGAIRRCVVHQFHNTSKWARVRQDWSLDDDVFLKEDGANIAPFLLRLREYHPAYYNQIVETVRLAAPFFADFELEPRGGTVGLRWRERGSDIVFGSHQMSDGTLRFVCLVTALLQPQPPSTMVIDEPELGLHPAALMLLAGLLRQASERMQLLVSTQSATLLDQFEPGDALIVERREGESTFRRLDEREFAAWRAEYTLGDLWQKNLIGGGPYA